MIEKWTRIVKMFMVQHEREQRMGLACDRTESQDAFERSMGVKTHDRRGPMACEANETNVEVEMTHNRTIRDDG